MQRTRHLTLDLCLRIGELLLSSGAGAADVVATMQAVARHLGLRQANVDVTFTQLAMSWQPDPGEPPMVLLRNVVHREIDYQDLARVDRLVRQILNDEVDLTEARAIVAKVSSTGHRRHRVAVTAGWGAMSAGVALMLGGGPVVCAIAFLTAAAIDRLQAAMARRRLPSFYRQVAGGAVATFIAVATASLDPDLDPSLVVTANIVMLLSGIGFMGALQDCLTGFYVTGSARITEALLATGGIIAGVSGGLSFAHIVNVDVGRVEPWHNDLQALATIVAGAAVCAAGFAYASYAPTRTLLPVAALAAVALLISRQVDAGGFGTTWGTGVAAFVVGLVAWTLSRWFAVPPLVIVVSAVVPMLPGFSIYGGLSALGGDRAEPVTGILSLGTAASVSLALAAGVILGEYVAQPVTREARKLERRLAGPRLVGPMREKSA